MDKPTIKIGVVSDVVCPWCYIGKRRLENAMLKVSDKFNFEVEYFPFELNPKMPIKGVNQKQYLSDKFGGEDRYNQITSHTTAVAAEEGLTFNFKAQQVSPNTRNGHRLIQLAREDGKQLELVEALFKAYFSDGIDLSKLENLTAIAAGVGMDETKVAAFLLSDTGITEVEMAEHELHELGITGVPFYVINNKYGISGAQSPESFVKVFEEIRATSPLVSDEACDVDGKNC
jgi:predicted DsbA family dithiol-disulfide isomerase